MLRKFMNSKNQEPQGKKFGDRNHKYKQQKFDSLYTTIRPQLQRTEDKFEISRSEFTKGRFGKVFIWNYAVSMFLLTLPESFKFSLNSDKENLRTITFYHHSKDIDRDFSICKNCKRKFPTFYPSEICPYCVDPPSEPIAINPNIPLHDHIADGPPCNLCRSQNRKRELQEIEAKLRAKHNWGYCPKCKTTLLSATEKTRTRSEYVDFLNKTYARSRITYSCGACFSSFYWIDYRDPTYEEWKLLNRSQTGN